MLAPSTLSWRAIKQRGVVKEGEGGEQKIAEEEEEEEEEESDCCATPEELESVMSH